MGHLKTFEDFLNENLNKGNLNESTDWNDDMYSTKKILRKKYLAKSDDEITIEAAKQVAKQHKMKYQDILKTYKPSQNIRGSKTWDKDGNIEKY
jgi:hypothetical protein